MEDTECDHKVDVVLILSQVVELFFEFEFNGRFLGRQRGRGLGFVFGDQYEKERGRAHQSALNPNIIEDALLTLLFDLKILLGD